MKLKKLFAKPYLKYLLAVVVVAGAIGVWTLKSQPADPSTEGSGSKTQPTAQTETPSKTATDTSTEPQSADGQDDQSDSSTSEPTQSGSIIITFADATSVKTLIEGYTSGTCKLTLSKSGQTSIQRTANVVFAPPSYYACNGFSFDRSIFPAGGTWKAQVTVEGDNRQAESQVKEINVD